MSESVTVQFKNRAVKLMPGQSTGLLDTKDEWIFDACCKKGVILSMAGPLMGTGVTSNYFAAYCTECQKKFLRVGLAEWKVLE